MGKKRKKGLPVHGWVVLDKPEGMGSTQAVGKVRWLFNAQKAGHGGTLDPFATGILPIALGEATKTVPYIMEGEKRYRFTVRWGVATDTLDTEGEETATSDKRPSEDDILDIMPAFVGVIDQVPPAYSAIKIDGERAYDLARAGEMVEIPSREVEIFALELIDIPDRDHAVFDCECGKGTYVRALARDMAAELGTVAMVSSLRRTRVGPFEEADAVALTTLEPKAEAPAEPANSLESQDQSGHKPAQPGGAPISALLPIEAALDGIPAIALSEVETSRLRNGQAVSLLRKLDLERISDLEPGDEVVAMHSGEAVAIACFDRGEIRPLRVFVRG